LNDFAHEIGSLFQAAIPTLVGMKKLFTEHPATVGEDYLQHMQASFSFGGTMLRAGLACLVHGVFPFLCVRTGSTAITGLYERMVTHRNRASLQDARTK
jgi:hypothetical protein